MYIYTYTYVTMTARTTATRQQQQQLYRRCIRPCQQRLLYKVFRPSLNSVEQWVSVSPVTEATAAATTAATTKAAAGTGSHKWCQANCCS